MKKGYILLLLLVLLIFQFVPSVAAQNEKVEPYEAYGLCVVSKIMEYNEKFNMDAFVDLETYDKIISFWFGAKTVANASPTNADAIYDLSYTPTSRSICDFTPITPEFIRTLSQTLLPTPHQTCVSPIPTI